MGKQRTPQGRAPGGKSPPRKSPVDALQAALPQTVPDAATLQPDPLARSIAQAIHEPPHAHPLEAVSSEAITTTPRASTAAEAQADGPVPADANLSEAPVSDAAEVRAEPASVIAAEPVVEAAPAIEGAAPVIEEAAPAIAAAPASDPLPEAVERFAPQDEPLPAESSTQAEPTTPSDPYANVVPLKASVPVVVRAPEPDAVPAEPDAPPAASAERPLPAPASWRAGRRAGVAVRHDLEGMGETLFAFVRNESTAALAHLAAMKEVRSPADAIRLQVSEIQRAADASLTCWSEIARRATRIVAQR